MGKQKRTKQNVIPKAEKHTKIGKDPDSTDGFTILWSFAKCDGASESPFPFCSDGDAFIKTILPKMIEFSRKTWGELKNIKHDYGKSANHTLGYDALTQEAQKRARELGLLDDIYEERLFSIRLMNLPRLIGLRDGRIFEVLWYDANHRVATTKKR